ncbi:asparagine synthase B [Candidatus Palauibacter sp.]|uniref:asparagine synthase B n=1 Tax=Candidatus Palauibacter sp. TaxID=3101350 RepID=UPI003B51C54B
MCSVLGIFEIEPGAAGLRRRALDLSRRQRHRGPDWSGIYAGERAILAHERLSIVDVESGAQPLFGSDRSTVLAVNGEIYNHKALEDDVARGYPFRTRSDCEVILALYEGRPDDPAAWLNELSGIFAFALYDEARDRYLIARDPIGVMPLYTGRDVEGRFYVASEMKALIDTCPEIHDFPPGHMLDSRSGDGRPTPYYRPGWREYDAVAGGPTDPGRVREALEEAVHRQLMSDVPYGVLLSGGLDSSIISALAMKFSRRRVETGDAEEAWWPRLHSFAIGLEGAPDLEAARAAAEAIGTVHHEIVYTLEEGLDAISDVIRHLETFDVTTVRASTPMYLMARRIKAMGIKMVLSGEGADEVFGGYLYFHKAPDARAFHEETVRKLDQLHKYDCLRANKSMAAWGVEARVPFLDREFLDVAMSLDPESKRPADGSMEKHILREAFEGLLPDEILWRQKEQFSDGVGYSWIDSLKEVGEAEVSDGQLARAAARFPTNTPLTKEAYLYRSIFASHFPGEPAARCVPEGPSIACSTPAAIAWDPAFAGMADPSGRAVQGVHAHSY